jgi:chaperonin GroES
MKAEAKTASGLYIPEKNVEKLSEAKVLAVGPGALDKDGKRITPSVAPGDRVLIPPFGGSTVKIGDEVCDETQHEWGEVLTLLFQDYLLFRDSEILAKLTDEK